MINHLDLFSGIGGFAYATNLAGIPIGVRIFSEVDENAQKVYHRHFPRAIPLGDIKRVKGDILRNKYPGPWLCTGGFPCQDITDGGTRAGLAGSRSSLWWEMHRIIGELRPEVVLIENVPALAGKGLERILFGLAQFGYDAEWEVVSARDVGAPHLRRRIWIVAYANRNGCNVSSSTQFTEEARPDMGISNVPNQSNEGYPPWSEWKTITATGQICAKPYIFRVDDGVPGGLDETLWRIKACGNSIVPQVAAKIMKQCQSCGILPYGK